MSTFVLLLMTSCVPGFDTVPMAGATSSYGEGGWSGRNAGGRHGFFGRIRGFFTRRAHGGNSPNPAKAKEDATPTGAVANPAPPMPASGEVLPGPVSPVILRPAPVIFSPGGAPPQRMPVGSPLPQIPTPNPY